MTQQKTFIRRIIYVAIIAGLLVPLYILSSPETKRGSGGQLARIRKANRLSESNLGEIDPASGAARLCTFGMRGVAVAMLWQKAQDYQKRKLWLQLKATSEQIMHLEPHFIEVWQNLTWNLAYNVSAEFDDYRERYRWVIAGVEFGARGCDHNRHSAVLPWYVGWVISQKIGRADEKKQFRRLFREDDEFHEKFATPTRDKRDNWLLGKDWYKEAEDLYESGASIGKKSVLIFYSRRPMCQMNHGEAIGSEGEFGERAKQSWLRAEREWIDYGNRTIPSTTTDQHGKLIEIALNDFERYQQDIKKLENELQAIRPGLLDTIRWEKWQAIRPREQASLLDLLLPDDSTDRTATLNHVRERLEKERPDWRDELAAGKRTILNQQQWEALETAHRLRTPQQQALAEQAQMELSQIQSRAMAQLAVTNEELAHRVTGDVQERARALEIAQEIDRLEARARIVNSYRDLVSYDYWLNTARVEQSQQVRDARSLVFDSVETYYKGQPLEANELYLAGLEKWKEALENDDLAFIRTDSRWTRDLMERVEKYKILLDNIDEIFPENFPLQDLVHREVSADAFTIAARTALQQGKSAMASDDLDQARSALEAAVTEWDSLLATREYLNLMADREVGEEILETAALYADVLRQQRDELPASFPLNSFLRTIVRYDENLPFARRHARTATQRLAQSEYAEAQAEFESSIEKWAAVLKRFPALYVGFEPAMAQEIHDTLGGYRRALQMQGKEIPEDMPLATFVEVFGLPPVR